MESPILSVVSFQTAVNLLRYTYLYYTTDCHISQEFFEKKKRLLYQKPSTNGSPYSSRFHF